jgi:hypothetical protein
VIDVNAFWKDVLVQDREKLSAYFCEDARIRWHCTNEEFTLNEYIRANCEYPGDWDGTVERVVYAGQLIITVVKVYLKDASASFHVTSFAEVKDGKILALDEYWADDGEAPQWRQAMKIGNAIL